MTEGTGARGPRGDWLRWTGALAAFVLLATGLRAMVDPGGAAAAMGLSGDLAAAEGLMMASGARGLGLGLVGVVLAWRGSRGGLAALVAAAGAVALMDAGVVQAAAGWDAAAKHIAYAFGLAGIAALHLGPASAPAERD